MTQADEIRAYVLRNYIVPARKSYATRVTVRAGDVAKALKLQSRMPNVCGALGTTKFQTAAGLKLIQRDGPGQGANATFTFAILTRNIPLSATAS
jgi:hypothetical protein